MAKKSPISSVPGASSRIGSNAEHKALVNAILARLGALPHIRLWQNQTGVARSMDGDRIIKFGLVGSSDILGVIAPHGRILAIEVKTGAARQTGDQKRFQKMITAMGGVYILARSTHDVMHLETLDEAS